MNFLYYPIRNIYVLSVTKIQAEGSEVSAELEFLNQQNLILSMENKALKQRLENLTQEQLIKYCEYLSLIPYLTDIYFAWYHIQFFIMNKLTAMLR